MSTAIATTLATAALIAATTPLVIAAANTASLHALPTRWPGYIGLGILLAGAAGALNWQRGPATAALCTPLLLLGAAAALVDLHEYRLPDTLTIPLLAATLFGIGLHSLIHRDDLAAMRAVVGLAIAVTMMLAAKLARPDAIGWGDIKLAPSLGASLGHTSWQTLYAGLMSWWLLILLTTALAALRRRPTEPLPYGPAMILGTLGAVALS